MEAFRVEALSNQIYEVQIKFDLRSGSIFRSLGKSNSGIPRRKRKYNVPAAKIGPDPVCVLR